MNWPLPEPHYYTFADVAAKRGVSADHIQALVDCGWAAPSALVAKAELGLNLPGPSPFVCVALNDYNKMKWSDGQNGRCAYLEPPVIVWEFDRDGMNAVEIHELPAPVIVTRSRLVLQPAAISDLDEYGREQVKDMNPTERTTLLRIIGASLEAASPDWREHPYKAAGALVEVLREQHIRLSQEVIAQKLRAAAELVRDAEMVA